MSVILYYDIGVLCLYHVGELAKQCRLTNTRHVLKADFRSSSGNGGIAHDDGRGFGAILRTRMEPKDNRVTGFNRD